MRTDRGSRRSDVLLGADGKRFAIGGAAERRIVKHLELRAEGLTVRQIANLSIWSYPTVWRDITQYRPVSRGTNVPRETANEPA